MERFDAEGIGERVALVFWLITDDKLVDKEAFETVACVVFETDGKVWFERFDDDEIGEGVAVVFWLITDDKFVDNEPFAIVACVLLKGTDRL